MDQNSSQISQTGPSPLSSVVAGTASLIGTEFFHTFIQHLAEAYGAQYAIANELIDNEPIKVKTLAFWQNGQLGENFEYEVKTTPCECVYRDGLSYFPDDIQNIFSDDEDLVHMAVNSYYGIPLTSSSGEVIGHICILGKDALAEADYAEEYFKIFSARAASELQRLITEREVEKHRDHLKELVDEQVHSIREANEAARIANDAQNTFLSRMSHELKTPMNAILGFSEILQSEDENLTEEQKEYLSIIINSGWRLDNVISEILDITKLEAGDIETNLTRCDVSEIINECITLIKIRAEKTGIEISYLNNDITDACIIADKSRFKQIIINLLSNAVKFNNENGKVTINLSLPEKEKIHIAISDTGPGISEDEQTKVFDRFERLDADKKCIEGTGIGLAITKRLVEHMGGAISIESTAGKGSTFWVEFDVAPNKGKT